ncbi:adenylate/guanylate cyclase domain-containing protein [Myceligenerans cantabricum]
MRRLPLPALTNSGKDLADRIHTNVKIATVEAAAVKRVIQATLAAGATVVALATSIGIMKLQGKNMDGNSKAYDYLKSSERIKEILDQPAGSFEEVDSLPDRDRLTYTNGFYGKCSAVFIDIRDSSGLTTNHKRPTLAKIYRSFISEMVAVLNSDPNVREVNIVGDCVWAVSTAAFKTQIDGTFSVAAKANTLIKLLNYHFDKKGLTQIRIGIGLDFGRALMIQAGFSGSGINDVIYMGDVVNRAAHLAHEAGRRSEPPIFVGSGFQANLNDHNKGLLTPKDVTGLGQVYTGDVVFPEMNNWVGSLT